MQSHDGPGSLRRRLERQCQPLSWGELRAQHEREAIFLVKPPLALMDAAIAIAEDDVTSVERWIALGQLLRPAASQLNAWHAQDEKPFQSVVVSPFVLVAEVIQ